MFTQNKPTLSLKSILFTFALCVSLLASPLCRADEAPSATFDTNSSSTDNLLRFKGKPVSVTTISGQTITGSVKEVKNGMLHLEKLAQKEYFDAIIMVDKITSVEARVRTSL